MRQHDFVERLAYSERASHEPFWDAVYRKAFHNMVNHMPCPGDAASQRMGIDRLVFLANGKTVAIDEKKREGVYGDIYLEYISVDTNNTPGWIEKDLAIDYLAYAFMPIQRVYLFPWDVLRRAWLRFGNRWKAVYACRSAQNNGYKTWGVCVPISVVQSAVRTAAIIDVDVDMGASI